jgi:hypothetical protein
MNEKMKFNLIGAGIAFVILGSLATWGITSFKHGMDAQVTPPPMPTISALESTPPPRLTATLPPTPTPVTDTVISGYKFHGSSINGEKIIYQGTETSIAMLPQDVKVQVLKSAISTDEESVEMISGIHDKWNETTGWGNINAFSATGYGSDTASLWVATLTKLVTSAELYTQMAAVNVSEDVKKDLNNVAALMKIAHEKRDPKALVYAHRIIHDLDYWVYNTPGSAQNPDKFGAAHAYKNSPKSTVATIEAFISKNQ